MSHRDKLQAFVQGQAGNYGEACCGRNSFLWHAALEGLRGEKAPLVALLSDPGLLARATGSMPDVTLTKRVAGFASVLDGHLKAAAEAFDSARYPGEAEQESLAITDELTVSLEEVFSPLPPLDTPGGWIVFDTLGRIQSRSGEWPPLANAEVPVLLDDGGNGQLAKFVLELVPGPAGLVTPDWWAMGLMRFPGARGAHPLDNFVESTQRLLRAIWSNQPNRLRWRLEAWQAGPVPDLVHGRSGEGAVACAGRSVLFSQSAVPSERDDAVLNPTIGITATVAISAQPIKDWPLGTVSARSIPNKFRAAAAGGLTEVLVATDQGPTPLPTDVHSLPVARLADAYFEMQFDNEHVRDHQERMYAPFNRENPERKWDLEETPQ